MMKNRVKDLNIKIDLSVLNDIKDTLIQNLSKTDFSKNADYSSDGYCKVIIYDGIAPFIFDDFDELEKSTTPSSILSYDKFLKSNDDKFKFTSFLGELNDKLIEHYGCEVIFRLEFTQLQPNKSMHPHFDIGRHMKERLNIVFEDDTESGFQSGEFLYPMKKNKIYQMDVINYHKAVNHSNKVRHALILDVIKNFSDLKEFKMETLAMHYQKANTRDAFEKFKSLEKIYSTVKL